MGPVVDNRGVSLLVEYLILMGILSVFVVVMSLQIHDTLNEVQLSRVVENNFADVASQISAIYTDYILILPESGSISTNIEMPSVIGSLSYSAKLKKTTDWIAYVTIEGGKYSAVSGLGLAKFISNSGKVIPIGLGGEILSFQSEAEKREDKPKAEYEKSVACPFTPKPRLEFIPTSVPANDEVTLTISFKNADEIKEPIEWKLVLWNDSILNGTATSGAPISMKIRAVDYQGNCNLKNGSIYDYECFSYVEVNIVERPECNGTNANKLLISTKPEESNPYIVYEKWVEPTILTPGEEFEVHLRIEGRGFFVEGATNLSVVHVIDVSGSMIWPTIFKDYSFTVNPNVVKETVTLSSSGKLEIWAYTSDRLTNWYSNSACKVCSGSTSRCPWYNVGYDESFIKLYVNGVDSGSDYNSGGKIGKYYSQNNAPAGNYTIEVVARAPEQINLTIVVKHKNTEILNKTVKYLNREEVRFELPSGVNYAFLAIRNIQNIPTWSAGSWNYDSNEQWNRIEDYTVDGQRRYWEYRNRICGYQTFTDNSLNVWLVKPNGSKEFLMKRANDYPNTWYQARNNYYRTEPTNGIIDADVFIPNPQTGEYKLVVVPTTKNPVTFTATALIKRIDAAKLAGITFNSMLGDKDFVGLTTFTTDAQRIVVNSSSTVLKYMTNDKSAVNSRILGLRAESATDHSDGLYYGSKVFPIWNEVGNNCSACISGLRPLIIMLTDGEPTTCNQGANYYNCTLCNQYCSGGSWCEVAKNQSLCIANYLKENVRVNDFNNFNISICTIGFSTDVTGRAQEFLRQMASLRPDNNEPCYFFATTSDELVEAYRTIFNAFQIAAKEIYVVETLNVSLSSPFKILSVKVTSNKNTSISQPEITETVTNTIIRLNITSIQKDEVIELVVKLKVKDEAPYGEFDINDDNNSFIQYIALDNTGNEVGTIKLPITSTRDKVRIVSGEEACIYLGKERCR